LILKRKIKKGQLRSLVLVVSLSLSNLFISDSLIPLDLQGWKGVQDHHSNCWENWPVPPSAVPMWKTEGYASRNHPSTWCCPQGVTILEV
jgi:hypothetical protein